MTTALLLDEMFDPRIARALCELGHDCLAVVADPALRESNDRDLFAIAARDGRVLVTNNVSDFERPRRDAQHRGATTAPLIYTSDATFPRDRRFLQRIVEALDRVATSDAVARSGGVLWLEPTPRSVT